VRAAERTRQFGEYLLYVSPTSLRNAILQSLFSLEEFNLALEQEVGKKTDKPIVNSYLRLLQSVRLAGDRDTVSPSEFKTELGRKKTRFSNSQQQDAQEMLTAFLESANEEMCRVKEKAKYLELKGDLSKESVKKIVKLLLRRRRTGGTTSR
jgi:ubiquitin C-terminal hydrolase